MFALAILDQGRQDHQATAIRPLKQRIHNLLGRLLVHFAPTLRAVRLADARVQEPQIVIHFGGGADGGAWVLAGTFLINRNRRAQAFYLVHVGLVHLTQELARVGRQ